MKTRPASRPEIPDAFSNAKSKGALLQRMAKFRRDRFGAACARPRPNPCWCGTKLLHIGGVQDELSY